MALNIRKFFEGIGLVGKSASTIDTLGEMEVLNTTNKLQFHNGTTASAVVTETHTATLTNKTLTSPVINTSTLSVQDTGAAFGLSITSLSSPVLSANRTLTFDTQNASRTITVVSNATIGGGNTGDVTLGPVGSSPNSDGATLTGQALALQPADATNPGVLTAIAQTIGGAKTFSSAITASPTTNQLVLGVTNTTTINSVAPSASRVVTIPDAGADSSVVLSEGASTVNGAKTFSNLIVNSTITTPTNTDLTLNPNGSGTIVVSKNILPNASGTRALGATNNFFSIAASNEVDVTNLIIQNSGMSQAIAAFVPSGTIPSGTTVSGSFKTTASSVNGYAFATESDSTVDSVATGQLRVETGNKTAGTGNSGNIVLQTGTSIGGARGKVELNGRAVRLNAQSATDPVSPTSADVYYNTTENKFKYYDGAQWLPFGSGSSGVTNLIENGDADTTVSSIFVPYANTPGVAPINGTGGSPSVTTSVSATSPLSGLQSFILTKPAATNAQGNGWAIPFTVDPAYRGKSLKISADYIVNSGTFVAGNNNTTPALGSVVWYVYDVTNSRLIQPSNIKMFSQDTVVADIFEATFQSSATGSSYRLIAHVATTDTAAFSLKVDNVICTPQVAVYGSPITNMRRVTTGYSWNNVSIGNGFQSFSERVVGDHVEVVATLEFGSTTSVSGTIGFDMPYTIDTNKLPDGFSSANPPLDGGGYALGTFRSLLNPYLGGASRIIFNATGAAAGGDVMNGTFPYGGGWATGYVITFRALFPAVGLSSTSRISDGYDAREISLIATKSSAQSIPDATNTTITGWSSASVDSVVAFNPTTGEYTVKKAGRYQINARTLFDTNATGTRQLNLYKNNTFNVNLARYNTSSISDAGYLEGSTLVDCIAGDILKLSVSQNSGGSLDLTGGSPEYFRFELFLVNSAQTISESEEILATAEASGALTFTSGSPINFNVVTKDTHAGITTGASWRYDIKFPGDYEVTAQVEISGSGGAALLQARVNGVASKYICTQIPNIANGIGQGTVVLANLNAGDYIDLIPNFSGVGESNPGISNYISIYRIK